MIEDKYEPPFIQLYVKQHWDELRDIPAGARGIYISLVFKTWQNDCEWIKDDDQTHRVLKVPPRNYERAKPYLMKLCRLSDDSCWEIPWLRDNYKKVMKQREANIHNGRLGGLARVASKQPLSHIYKDR